jgi:hypothetical protein
VLARNRRQTAVISIITLGEFVVIFSRAIAWHTAALQNSLSLRLGENDAWIAATSIEIRKSLVLIKTQKS